MFGTDIDKSAYSLAQSRCYSIYYRNPTIRFSFMCKCVSSISITRLRILTTSHMEMIRCHCRTSIVFINMLRIDIDHSDACIVWMLAAHAFTLLFVLSTEETIEVDLKVSNSCTNSHTRVRYCSEVWACSSDPLQIRKRRIHIGSDLFVYNLLAYNAAIFCRLNVP